MKVLKTLLLIVLALVALVVAGAGIFLATFDVNDYKDQLIARVKADTGRELVLNGPLELALWPKIRLKAGPLTLANAAGFGDEPLFSAEQIEVAVATGPLLRKRVEMDTVVLHGVRVNLARNAAGVGNWADLLGPNASGQSTQPKRGGGGQMVALILGGVDITDGRFTWHDALSGQQMSLTKITASTGALRFGKPIDLKISTTARANQPALDADINLTGTLNYNVDDKHYVLAPLALVADLRGAQLPGGTAKLELDAGLDVDLNAKTAKLSGFKLDGLGTSVSGEFSAHNIEDAQPSATGQLVIKGADLAQLFNAFALPAGKQLAGVAERSFNFTTAFDADMDSGDVKVTQLEGKLLGAQLNGAFTASKANTDKPTAKGEVTASGADFPAVLAVAAALQGKDSALAAMAQSLARESNKHFRFECGFDADLASGRVALTKLAADVVGLTLRGALHGEGVDLSKREGQVNGELTIESAGPGPLLRAVGQGEMARAVQNIKLDTGVQGSLDDLRLSPLSLIARVTSPELAQPVDVEITAESAHANLKAETASIKRLTVTGLGLNAQADIEAEQVMSKPVYTGSLTIPSFNPRQLLKTLHKPMPKTADVQALSVLAVSTRFAGSTSGIKLGALQVTLDDTHMQGDIDVAAFTGPQLSFTLAVDAIDADRYLAAPAKGDSKTIVTPDAAVAGAANALPVEQLRTLKAKGALTLAALTMSGAKMKNVKFALDAAQGLVKLEPLAAQLYQGSYGGGVVLDARGEPARLALKTQLDKVQIEALLKDTTNNDSLSGAVSFDAAFEASGGDAAQVKQTLDGAGRFGIAAGVFRGVDAVAILRAVEQIIECRCVVPVPHGGQTQFKSLAGTLTVKNGVVRNEDLRLNGEGFTIKGRGMLVNLNDKTIKYDLQLAVAEQRSNSAGKVYKLGGYDVPIACRGRVDRPSCLPDFGHILGAVAKDAAKKKIEKALGKQLKGVLDGKHGETLKNLLKF